MKQCHELHIRWVSGNPFPSISPFVSTVSPGLHIFFTPQKNRSAYVSKPVDSIYYCWRQRSKLAVIYCVRCYKRHSAEAQNARSQRYFDWHWVSSLCLLSCVGYLHAAPHHLRAIFFLCGIPILGAPPISGGTSNIHTTKSLRSG